MTDEDKALAAILNRMLCTCVAQPMGLPFTLAHGCLVHDQCVCSALEDNEGCAWCASYIDLLKAIGSLDELERARLRALYLERLRK